MHIRDARFLFITGVEGSGTTMMLRLLDAVAGTAVLGGNYHSPRFESQAEAVNGATERLWRGTDPPSPAARTRLVEEIRTVELPPEVSLVVHKRSFPFLDRDHFPRLGDLAGLGRETRILVMRRDLEANARSILRRRFVADLDAARRRVNEGKGELERQLRLLPAGGWLEVGYEEITDPTRKAGVLAAVAGLVGMDAAVLVGLSEMITGPTKPG